MSWPGHACGTWAATVSLMASPVTLDRQDFVRQMGSAQFSVRGLEGDLRMTNVDVAKADLDKDGKIAGAQEIDALFTEVDKLDHDKQPDTITLLDKNKPTGGAAPLAALGDLGRAPQIQRLANQAIPGISFGSGRNFQTGIQAQANNPPANVGGIFGAPLPQVTMVNIQAKEIRGRVDAELKKPNPDVHVLREELDKLTTEHSDPYVRHLRLNDPQAFDKLKGAFPKGDTVLASLLNSERTFSREVIAEESKELVKSQVGPTWATVEAFKAIPKDERHQVLIHMNQDDPAGLKQMQQIARDSQDPALLAAFKRAGLPLK
jgi:hypothetical protein